MPEKPKQQHHRCLHVEEVPHHFRERFILSGYRDPNSTVYECMQSALQWNNETVNIWTHFIPGLFYIGLTYYLFTYEYDVEKDPYARPLLTYMITLCIMPNASAIAHLLNTMSDRARHVCFFLDYGGLSIYSLGAAIAYNAYSFPTDFIGSSFAKVFVPIAVFNAVMSMTLSCMTRFMDHGTMKKVFRISAYAVPYLFDVIPLLYRGCFGSEEDFKEGGLALHMRQFIFAALSAFLYLSHYPERLSPGTFDVFGHSHQIFHLTTLIGSSDQLRGFIEDMEERRGYLSSHTDVPSFGMTMLVMLLIATINVGQLIVFSFFLYKILPQGDKRTIQCTSVSGEQRKTQLRPENPADGPVSEVGDKAADVCSNGQHVPLEEDPYNDSNGNAVSVDGLHAEGPKIAHPRRRLILQ